jgi:hypothetical protein
VTRDYDEEQFKNYEKGKPKPLQQKEGKHLWERLPGETKRAFGAYVMYRDEGISRSYKKVAQSLQISETMIGRWGKLWHWTARTADYDNYLAVETTREEVEARKEMAKRHAQVALTIQNKLVTRLLTFKDAELAKMSLEQITKVFEIAAKMERLSRGESTENVQSKGQMINVNTELEADREVEKMLAEDPEGIELFRKLYRRKCEVESTGKT